MKATLHLWLVLAAISSSLLSAHADSWAPPREFDAFSENKQYVAHFIPGNPGGAKPQFVVYSLSNGNRIERWRASMSVFSGVAILSDDGEAVVTLDSWGSSGFGDNVVVIYGRTGKLANYSLEQIVPPQKPAAGDRGFWPPPESYGGKIRISTSSRHWRRNSFDLMLKDIDGFKLALWIDWAERWVTWRLSDGKLLYPTDRQIERLNADARTKALEMAKADDFSPAAFNLLGQLRNPNDRPLIEARLRDSQFLAGSTSSYSSSGGPSQFTITSTSYVRAEADRILARWDDRTQKKRAPMDLEEYHYLGILKFSANLVVPPQKGNGVLRAYLIPAEVPLNEWNRKQPEHYLKAALNTIYPFDFGTGPTARVGQLGKSVNCIIYGITPGKYRMKVVWDREPPQDELSPSAGDYESIASPLIEIRAGVTTKDIAVNCLNLVPSK